MSALNQKKYIIREVLIPAGGGSKHVIQENAVNFPSRTFLNFRGTGVNVIDDLGNNATVIEINSSGGGGSTSVSIVADIATRDALTPSDGDLVYVVDASADPAIDLGWAMYIWVSGAWVLMSARQVVAFDNLLDDSVESVEVGGIPQGTEMGTLRGLNPSRVLTQLIFPVIAPTYVDPTVSLSGSDPKLIKVGDVYAPTLTSTFNQNDAGSPGLLEIKRGVTVISNVSPTTDVGQVFNSPGISAYTSEQQYADGPIKNDSHGNPDPTGQILGPGPVISNQVQYEGIYPYFWGLSADRNVTGAVVAAGNEVLAKSNVPINIDFNSSNTDFIWFAVPDSFSLDFDTWFVDALNNGDIDGPVDINGNLFPDAVIEQVSSGGFVNVNYRVYISNYPTEVVSTMTLS